MTQTRAPDARTWFADQARMVPPGVRLRPALRQEEGAVMALRRACGWNAETVPQQFRAMEEGRRQIWIAECDGYLVATITVEWVADDRQLADGRTSAHVSNLVVHPSYRRRRGPYFTFWGATCRNREAVHGDAGVPPPRRPIALQNLGRRFRPSSGVCR